VPHFDYNSADRDILGFLHDVADAAADTLDEIDDWSLSGEREGQYSADVVIDDVIFDLLQAKRVASQTLCGQLQMTDC
jgi:hypothetical protein